MTEEERRFLCRLLLECGKARTTKTVRFGIAEEAFTSWVVLGAKERDKRTRPGSRLSMSSFRLVACCSLHKSA